MLLSRNALKFIEDAENEQLLTYDAQRRTMADFDMSPD